MKQFEIKIDGKSRKIDLLEGPSVAELSELLAKLSKCLGDKGHGIVISSIKEGSYGIGFTGEDSSVDEAESVHERIHKMPFDLLQTDEKEYAKAMDKIVFKRDFTLGISSPGLSSPLILDSIDSGTELKKYYSTKTVFGRVVAMYGKDSDHLAISFRPSDGRDIRVFVDEDQESELKEHYKESKISARIRFRMDADTGKAIYGKLLDFRVKSRGSFYQNISQLRSDQPKLLSEIDNLSDFLAEIRD